MKRLIREFLHDLREIKLHLLSVIGIALLFVVVSFFVQRNLDQQGLPNLITLPALEALIPSMGAYGALMLMQSTLDTEGCELVFTYARVPMYWGLIRQFRFYLLYSLFAAIVCSTIAAIMRIEGFNLLMLTLLQGYAVMGFAFLAACVTRKMSMGLIVLAAFVCIQIMVSRDMPQFNFIYSLTGNPPDVFVLNTLSLRCLAIGSFGWGIGQVWLRPR